MKDQLKLRGAVVILSRAIVHIGRYELVNDWDGSYRNPAVEKADKLLRLALWKVEADFRKVNERSGHGKTVKTDD